MAFAQARVAHGLINTPINIHLLDMVVIDTLMSHTS